MKRALPDALALQRPASAAKAVLEPVTLPVRWHWPLLGMILLLAAASQAFLYLQGLYSISADESARTLLAYNLTLAGAWEASIWPPLPKIVTGIALKLYGDLFITPRVIAGLMGIATLGALAFLARQLFASRMACIVATLLGVFVPHRLILGVVPLSDIYSFCFVLAASGFMIKWLRNHQAGALIVTCIWLLLASAARYEAWFFNLVLGVHIGYRAFIRRDIAPGVALLGIALLAAFPCAWTINICLNEGSLASIAATRSHFLNSYAQYVLPAIKNNVVSRFLADLVLYPALLIGILTLIWFSTKDKSIRSWAVLLFIPLGIAGAIMAITFSIPTAVPFRIDGVWVLLLVPFSAWTIVRVAGKISDINAGRYVSVAVMTAACAIPLAEGAWRTATRQQPNSTAIMGYDDRALGNYIRRLLRSDDRRVLIDAIGNLDYLNVLVASNSPQSFILNVDADPLRVAIYSREREFYVRQNRTDILEAYFTDKFALKSGLDIVALKDRNVGYILARDTALIGALAANPHVRERTSFGPWALFSLRDS